MKREESTHDEQDNSVSYRQYSTFTDLSNLDLSDSRTLDTIYECQSIDEDERCTIESGYSGSEEKIPDVLEDSDTFSEGPIEFTSCNDLRIADSPDAVDSIHDSKKFNESDIDTEQDDGDLICGCCSIITRIFKFKTLTLSTCIFLKIFYKNTDEDLYELTS